MKTERQDDALDQLERKISYSFRNRALLLQALTHASSRDKEHPCNERLEFLGDSILGQIVSEYLYETFPEDEEGELSTLKSVLVSSKILASFTKKLGIENLIILGKGIKEQKAIPSSILAGTFEAVAAALYLDGGIEPTRQLILSLTKEKLKEVVENRAELNHKSILQDYAQRTLARVPTYIVKREVGPDHRKMFQVVVEINGASFGPAWGRSKKEAEQRAARAALKTLEKNGYREGSP
ncbi:MAG: ribonuclease III [Planctomycetes bacterium RBG_16_59_8]|nr:MAG: ribonuclease III [Planctomycetes bacterium RBG_16_59_8]